MEQKGPEEAASVLLADKYSILGPIGLGGTAEVYLAEHVHLKNKWAVKRISQTHPLLDQTLREATILKDLSHPMLPRMTDILKQDGYVYLVMDYLQGETLRDRLEENGPLCIQEVADIGYQLTDVLQYLHTQNPPIIHRDIKPSNLLLDAKGRIHLIDFGSARGYGEDKTDDTVYLGTRGYAAPEQYSITQSDARTDLYSMGITLLVLLTGLSPVTCQTDDMLSAAKKRKLPIGMLQILEQCVQVMPSARPTGADAVMPYFREVVLQSKTGQGAASSQKQSRPYPVKATEDNNQIPVLSKETTEWPLATVANRFLINAPRVIFSVILIAFILYFVLRGLGWDIWPAFGWKVTGWVRDAVVLLKTNW